ncbi:MULTISPECIES: hypothetical protein [Streptomyces]|uniref:HEAT repeat-containing protein n=1 Tax=Streptomyces koelreuteriae TaxID=2838015 RepID=A0ABX8FRK0_9ACTN|nr:MULTISPECIES: hypothetical protein [Streptomyces]QWB23679.1 hypothetical protein KJK29_14305 [Streptomyces koelreuteriae]UUA06648.1 hypothetical protein NNW98_14375 [Streptomyces koelreuteriae]UUA14277.1 hypothetical protein NNW99_14370 [Streptomyces sp. CRCS-T-1]
MSQEENPADTANPAEGQDGEKKERDEAAEDQPRQEAWAARRDLIAHAPDFVSTLVSRDQFGQAGGTHYGDQHFHFGGRAETPLPLSGPVPHGEIEELQVVFRGCQSFDEALKRLRADRLVILSGGRETGRRTAALMLLHRLGAERLRSLDPPASFPELADQVDNSTGYVLCDLPVSRNRPLREAQLHSLRERLERARARLVITVEPSAALGDLPSVRWEPPSAEHLLHAHVTPATGESAWPELCGLTAVKEFLTRHHRPEEIRQFALRLVAHHRGEIDEVELAAFGETAVATQVTRWLTEEKPELIDKAFLVSLAVFDKAPYAVTAELADGLFVRLHDIQSPHTRPPIPVFGSSRKERLRLAHADGYVTAEVTEWGPLKGSFCAAFQDERTAPMLLEEVWNLHPSARPAFAEWIRKLADDRRPLVRTRAASAAALLAKADLSSAMAHLIEPWADSRKPHAWLTAANALTMTQLLEVPAVSRILHDWCIGDVESRRWTAIRAYGLLGPVHHEETLAALVDAMHRPPPAEAASAEEDGEPPEEARQLADALELLLLAVRDPVLAALTELRRTDRMVRPHALLAFFQACKQTKDDDSDRPPVLSWYARAAEAEDATAARQLADFWDALLADRTHNPKALGVLRGWVRAADDAPETESALASLLGALVATPTNRRRVGHLLGTVRDSRGAVTPAADRLSKRLALD